jgi:nucleotide-binding universal stress UspA family protein
LVGELLKFCKAKKANFIITNTHARKGLSRLFLGSFAETLITSSTLPILAVQPDAIVSDQIKRILFATDFSKNSNAGYKRTLEIAKKIGAEITLFHKRFSSVEPIVQSGVYMLGGGWVSTAQLLDDEEKATIELSNKWIQQAKQYDVNVNYVSNPADLAISNAIIETAKTKKADLIVVVNQTGRWGTVVLGSISRELLRQAPVPVLILHK